MSEGVFPTMRVRSSGHHLFVSVFMLASKAICNDTYSNKSWSIIAQGISQLREINQRERERERERCASMLNIDPATLKELVCKDFMDPGPYYLTYILPPK